MELTLESLGLRRDEILDRVVNRIAESVMESWTVGEDGDEAIAHRTPFAEALERKVMERVDAAVVGIAGRHVLPNVAAYVETLCLQETNKWGEKRGEPVSFVEYLVRKAEDFLREPVSFQGKTKGQDSYNWKADTTRIAYMIHEHLQYSIKSAMEQALKTANSAIVGGIEEAVKIKLSEVAASLKVKMELGR